MIKQLVLYNYYTQIRINFYLFFYYVASAAGNQDVDYAVEVL